jgi:hypothetical protein
MVDIYPGFAPLHQQQQQNFFENPKPPSSIQPPQATDISFSQTDSHHYQQKIGKWVLRFSIRIICIHCDAAFNIVRNILNFIHFEECNVSHIFEFILIGTFLHETT